MALVGPGVNFDVTPGHVLLYQVVAQAGDQTGYAGIHYRVANTSGQSVSLGELVLGLDGVFAPLMKPLLGLQASYRGSQIRNVWPLPLSPIAASTGAQGPGQGAGDLLPRQTAGVISKVTRFAGPWPGSGR